MNAQNPLNPATPAMTIAGWRGIDEITPSGCDRGHQRWRLSHAASSQHRLYALLCCIVTCLPGVSSAADRGTDPDRPPALLEPYAGYDMVFGTRGHRVLGPAASTSVQAMLEADKPALPQGCQSGDISIQPRSIAYAIECASTRYDFRLTVRDADSEDEPATLTVSFAIAPTRPANQACDPECRAVGAQLTTLVAQRVRNGEGNIVWQRVRLRDSSPASRWVSAMQRTHDALAIGSKAAAKLALSEAIGYRKVATLVASDALDLALLAREAEQLEVQQAAISQLELTLSSGENVESVADLGIWAALEVLKKNHEEAAKWTTRCARSWRRCDVVPAVRAMAATGRFRDAAALLDAGPLSKRADKPPLELLKLRFGLSSAQRDADGEIATAKRIMKAWPRAPDGTDLLSSGLLRSGRYRAAIELLHDLSRKHPERDIVLGRIAGMVAFLRGAAGDDPKLAEDLVAIEKRMADAAKDDNDIVARFLDATRKYYAGDLAASLPELEALTKTDNRDPRIPLYLAMAHFWLGHQGQAKRLIERAVEIGPSDPDVFYCRSQILRKESLPQAIADLERYVEMTNRPWALNPDKKDARVKAELDYMKRGLLPPDWDRPGKERVPFDPVNQKGTPVSEAVRLGTAPTPTAETNSTDAGQHLAQRAQAGDTASGQADPETQEEGHDRHDRDSQQRLPILILVALGAALAVRLWSRGQP